MKNIQKSGFKSFVTGVVLTAVLAVPFSSLAQSLETTIPITYNDIKVKLNGEAVTLKDVDGVVLEPLNYEGSVYVPIRGVSESLGMNVTYDEETKTVVIVGNTATEVTAPVVDNNFNSAVNTKETVATDNSVTNTEDTSSSSDESTSSSDDFYSSDEPTINDEDATVSDEPIINDEDATVSDEPTINDEDASVSDESTINDTDASVTEDVE